MHFVPRIHPQKRIRWHPHQAKPRSIFPVSGLSGQGGIHDVGKSFHFQRLRRRDLHSGCGNAIPVTSIGVSSPVAERAPMNIFRRRD
jgi:hypothetical protein